MPECRVARRLPMARDAPYKRPRLGQARHARHYDRATGHVSGQAGEHCSPSRHHAVATRSGAVAVVQGAN